MINPDPKMIAQLNLLSDLLGNPTGDTSRTGLVKLTLFDEEDDDDLASRSVFLSFRDRSCPVLQSSRTFSSCIFIELSACQKQ